MYYLRDLLSETVTPFPDAPSLARAWRERFGDSFDELNVTGRDSRAGVIRRVVRAGGDSDGETLVVHERVEWSRRFQVLDEDGRSVDVREWPEDVFRTERRAPRRCRAANHGGRAAHPHRRGPTLQLGAIRAAADRTYLDECDERPTRDNSGIRRKATMTAAEFGDHCGSRWKKSDSWKDQTRAPRQFARHKHGVGARALAATRRVDVPRDEDDQYLFAG